MPTQLSRASGDRVAPMAPRIGPAADTDVPDDLDDGAPALDDWFRARVHSECVVMTQLDSTHRSSASNTSTGSDGPRTAHRAGVVHAEVADFESKVLAADRPVLVDFWATWCGPCRALGPHLERLAEERSDDLQVVKVDVDAQPALAQKYEIRAMPTLVLFQGGKEIARHVGAPRGRVALERFATSGSTGR